jgi:sugar phosphate permease
MPVTERAFAQGITHSCARLGLAAAPPIVLAIALAYGWRQSFIVLGVACLVWTVLWLWLYRDTPAEHRRVSAGELAEIGVKAAEMQRTAKGKTPWMLMLKRMWLVTFIDFCYGWALWVFLTWLPSYLTDARKFDLKHMAFYAAMTLWPGVVGDTVGGVISDFVLKKTQKLKLARCGLLVVGLTGAVAFILPAIFTDSPVAAVYYLGASFFFLELNNAVVWSLPIDIAGKYAGTAGGMMNTGFGVAGMLSPLAFGVLIDMTGSYVLPFMITAGLLVIGAICALFVDPAKHIDLPAS